MKKKTAAQRKGAQKSLRKKELTEHAGKRGEKSAENDGLYVRALRRIGHAQVEHPYLVILIVAALTLFFLGGAGHVKTVAALENMMPQDLEEIAAANTLRDAGLGQDMIAVVISLDGDAGETQNTDILTWEKYVYIKSVSDALAEEQDIVAVNSLSTLLEHYAGGELNESSFETLIENETIRNSLGDFVNDARTNTIIIASTDVSANDARMNLLAESVVNTVNSLGRPAGAKIQFTGTPIIQQELGKLIASDRSKTQLYSTIFVFVIVMLIFGTFTSALVPILVVTISVTWLYGTMGYTGLPISTLAGGVAAMVIGIGIDYAIHLMNKYKYERKQGLGVKEGIEAALTETGVATTGASITTMLAFIAFLTGAMPEMHRFGLLMTIGVGYSFLLTILALPAMLIVEERLFFLLRRHLHFGPEGEYFLATQEEACPPGFTSVSEDEHAEMFAKMQNKYRVFKHPKKSGKETEKREQGGARR